MSKSLAFSYDQDNDIMTIEGIKYSGDLFRAWGENGIDSGQLFKILRIGETLMIGIEAPK